MAKIRTASVDDDVTRLVDEGAQLDAESKKHQARLKEIKEELTGAVSFEEGESSVRVAGENDSAVVTCRKSVSLGFDGAEDEERFRNVFEGEKFSTAVGSQVVVRVAPGKMESLLDFLGENNYGYEVNWSLRAQDVVAVNSPEAKAILEKATKVKTTTAVKFEW